MKESSFTSSSKSSFHVFNCHSASLKQIHKDSMSRSNQNFTPSEDWRSRPDYGPYHPRQDSTSRMASVFPLYTHLGAPLDYREDNPWWLMRERGPGGPVGSVPISPYISNLNQYPDYGATRTLTTRHPATDPSPSLYVQRNVQAAPEEDSKLTREEQKRALGKLKKEIYNPTPKWLKRRPSLYFRDNPISSSRESENDNDDDGKRCAICLEDFEPKELVTSTPCKHMFHEECIVPWVKSQGQCPVCRFAIVEQARGNVLAARNRVANDQFENELMTIMRAMEQAFVSETMRRM